jgi:succinoglycan biosynthesis protein ExoA
MKEPVKRALGSESSDTALLVSIIVPCRNERDSIEDCMHLVAGQESVAGGFELLVVDGLSDDGTREILERLRDRYSFLRLIDNPARIVSTGLNAAIRAARGDVIIRMDAHTEYAPDYVRRCLEVLEETGADNVGGPARTKAVGYIGSAICAAYHSPFGVGGARFHKVEYEGYVDTVTYGCWHREVFDEIGLFDEELVRNQDDEFNLRLVRTGGKIWQSPRIKSWYRPRSSLVALFKQYLQYGYWKVKVIQKHKMPASVRHLIPGGFVAALLSLPLAAAKWSLAWSLWLGLMGTYSAALLIASILATFRHDWKLLPVLPVVFACYHVSYGLGFLWGIFDFVILRRKPRPALSLLTRAAEANAPSASKSGLKRSVVKDEGPKTTPASP